MTLMCIDRSQSPTHKGNFLQGGKQTVSNNINHQQNANHRRNNSCSPPLNKSNNNNKDEFSNNKSNQDSPRKLERSSSESSAINSRGQSSSSNSSRYKTELCRPYEESGVCKYGDKCQFAHGIKELRSMARHPKYKTELCRTFHSTGLCPYGPRCHFIHNSEQTKKILLNNLTGQPTSNNRPKALSSIGSAGDVSPASSNGGTPTGTKSFDDMFQMSPASPGNVFFPQDNQVNNFQRYSSDYPVYDYKTDIYDSINVFNDKLVSVSSLDNFSFQSGPVLELCPSAPLTPATPIDSNHLIFRLPIFDGFQNGK